MKNCPTLILSSAAVRANGRRVKEDNEPSFTLRAAVRNGVSDGMKVRYLTPLECERLMGWPDNWTKYGIESDGKTIELSDNQRYYLIGNGVVPQVVENIIGVMYNGGE